MPTPCVTRTTTRARGERPGEAREGVRTSPARGTHVDRASARRGVSEHGGRVQDNVAGGVDDLDAHQRDVLAVRRDRVRAGVARNAERGSGARREDCRRRNGLSRRIVRCGGRVAGLVDDSVERRGAESGHVLRALKDAVHEELNRGAGSEGDDRKRLAGRDRAVPRRREERDGRRAGDPPRAVVAGGVLGEAAD